MCNEVPVAVCDTIVPVYSSVLPDWSGVSISFGPLLTRRFRSLD